MITARFPQLIPSSADALTVWPFIFVRPHRSMDEPLLAHELVHHAEQGAVQIATAIVLALLAGSPWWMLFAVVPAPVWFLLYAVPTFRLHAEVRGYRRQIQLGGIGVTEAAWRIATKYHLKNVTQGQVVDLLLR